VIADAAFVMSLAGLNASLAGLGGLLVGLRRGPGLDSLEALRLRQVVEFAFANLLLAISVQPAAQLLGDAEVGIRVSSAATLVYVLVAMAILQRRVSRVRIEWGRWWAASAIGLTLLAAVVASVAISVPTAGIYELLLVVMLCRPITTLVLVLGTIDEEIRRGSTSLPEETMLRGPAADETADKAA